MFSSLFITSFCIVILLYVKDVKDIEIFAMRTRIDKTLMAISMVIILGITLIFAQKWSHYVVGILGLTIILLEFNRRGITTKGFVVSTELSIFGHWKKIHSVELTQNDRIKLSIMRRPLFRDEVHYYDPKQYEKIETLLLNYLPKEKVSIRETT